MKILVISQYFPPEPGAPSNRVIAFVKAMVARGHNVTVICQFPNYPSGVLNKEDKWRLYRREKKDGYLIYRCFVLTFARKNNLKRMLYYLSFAFSSFLAAVFLKKRDVVFASSPPIFFVFGAMLASKIKRTAFVADIRDLWPDSAREVEAVASSRLLKWGGRLEKAIYNNASRLFTISAGLKNTIESRGGKGKTEVIYNGSVDDFVVWNKDKTALRAAFGWEGKLVITYAGIIGLGQNLLALVPELSLLASDDNLLFNFIGDGPQKQILEDMVRRNDLRNVRFQKHLPLEQAIDYICSSDIMLVILRESDLFKSAIPSKFFDSMAAGKPVISNVDGEMRQILESAGAGIYISLREKGALAGAIRKLAADENLRKTMGNNGRRLVQTKFMRHQQASRAIQIIEEIK